MLHTTFAPFPVLSLWARPPTIKVFLPPFYLWWCSRDKKNTRFSTPAQLWCSCSGVWEPGNKASQMPLAPEPFSVECWLYDVWRLLLFLLVQVVERISNAAATACSGPNEHAIGKTCHWSALCTVCMYQSLRVGLEMGLYMCTHT